jgi:hypothetical protein
MSGALGKKASVSEGQTVFEFYCTGPVFLTGGRRARRSLVELRLVSDLFELGVRGRCRIAANFCEYL